MMSDSKPTDGGAMMSENKPADGGSTGHSTGRTMTASSTGKEEFNFAAATTATTKTPAAGGSTGRSAGRGRTMTASLTGQQEVFNPDGPFVFRQPKRPPPGSASGTLPEPRGAMPLGSMIDNEDESPTAEEVEASNKNVTLWEQFAPGQGNKWQCSECKIFNNSTETKCACCEAPKVTDNPIASTASLAACTGQAAAFPSAGSQQFNAHAPTASTIASTKITFGWRGPTEAAATTNNGGSAAVPQAPMDVGGNSSALQAVSATPARKFRPIVKTCTEEDLQEGIQCVDALTPMSPPEKKQAATSVNRATASANASTPQGLLSRSHSTNLSGTQLEQATSVAATTSNGDDLARDQTPQRRTRQTPQRTLSRSRSSGQVPVRHRSQRLLDKKQRSKCKPSPFEQ